MTMDLKRTCIHEAGHFYVAFKYRPYRAVSICVSRKAQTDLLTGEEYISVGQAITFEPADSLVRVQVSIRAAGLAAESITYRETFEALMANPASRRSIKTDTDNAKEDLRRAKLYPCSEESFMSFYWRAGFDDAVALLRGSQGKLDCIAEYCLANLDREIPREELVAACTL